VRETGNNCGRCLPGLLLSIVWLGCWLPRPLQAQAGLTQTGLPQAGLTQVRQVRQLSAQAAGQSIPVRIRGIVTAMPGWRNSFFVQDATGGISVDRTDHAEVEVGDRVELTGVSSPGLFAPLVMASRVQVTGHGLPPPARRVNYADLAGGALDSEWVEVQGVVHANNAGKLFGRDVWLLNLAVGGGSLSVTLQDIAGVDMERLTDATVLFRGVSSTGFNEKRQFVGLGLLVPERSGVEVIHAGEGDPFAVPVTPVRNLFQFGQTPHRVKVQGTATYQIPGRSLYIQDGRDGILIQTASQQLAPPGSQVEAVGFPLSGDYTPRLEDGLLRIRGMGPPVVPSRIHAKDVSSITGQPDVDPPPYDQLLVQLQGLVMESHREGGEQIWTMRDGNQIFEAYLQLPAQARPLKGVGIGSVLSLTGICEVHIDSGHVPVSFSLRVRTVDDVVVVRRASWWTTVHASIVVASLGLVVMLTIVWVAVLRHRVARQTRIIRQSEARFRDLAERDALTGLPNRLMLEERIAKILAQSKADNLLAVVFTIDIDRFKHINDTYGHLVGDECLQIVASRLRGRVRKADTIARTGGEEFTIVVGGLVGAESAKTVSAGILDQFCNPLLLAGMELKITVSVGGALYPDDGTDSETLRRRSDQALYVAKRTGRNRAVFAGEAPAEANEAATSVMQAG
jgi:diguanylate cyclase (GGDEF)-like protein